MIVLKYIRRKKSWAISVYFSRTFKDRNFGGYFQGLSEPETLIFFTTIFNQSYFRGYFSRTMGKSNKNSWHKVFRNDKLIFSRILLDEIDALLLDIFKNFPSQTYENVSVYLSSKICALAACFKRLLKPNYGLLFEYFS